MAFVEGLGSRLKREPSSSFKGALRTDVFYVPVSESSEAPAKPEANFVYSLAPHDYVVVDLGPLLEISHTHFPYSCW